MGDRANIRPLTLAAFAMLAAYGALRWQTMLASDQRGRIAGLLCLSLAIVAITAGWGRGTGWHRRAVAAAVALAVVAMLPISGLPIGWALQLRVAAIVDAVSHGITSLPGVAVPYAGGDRATSAVIALGAGALMLAGALTLAAAKQSRGGWRLAWPALPLVVLAVVPSALAQPRYAYLHGLILLVLLALFVFSERVARGRAPAAIALLELVAAAALLVSFGLAPARPWVNVSRLTGRLAGADEAFNWAQNYGPLKWPATGTTVLRVRARFPYYWKAEDLDLFDGRGWATEPLPGGAGGDQFQGIAASSRTRWQQVVTVTVGQMTSSQVIAAGSAGLPLPAGQMVPGETPGTWLADPPLSAGERYRVDVYTPTPSAAQLAGAGTDYPLSSLAPDLQMLLPRTPTETAAPTIQFSPYGVADRLANSWSTTAGAARTLLLGSPYARAYRLATRLESGARTPYQYAAAVQRYLQHGFTYDQNPPATRYPILTFLFGNRLGYCQQFAGAMALLLRIGGVPARVAAGFTTGSHDAAAREYVVSDRGAHAWVEAWFPGYGWVTFDPTPTETGVGADLAPADAPRVPAAATRVPAATTRTHHGVAAPRGQQPRASRAERPGSGSSPALPLALAALGLVLVSAAVAFALRRRALRRRDPDPDLLVAELERAFARCGRPLAPGTTLAGIERALASAPDAAAYVARLQAARFATGPRVERPNASERRALRSAIRRAPP